MSSRPHRMATATPEIPATTGWKQAAKLRPADTMPADQARTLDAQMAMAQIGQD